MRRTAAVAAGAALLFSAGTAVPAAAAPPGTPVLITAHTSLVNEVAEFDASLDGCESGTVVNGENAMAHFTPWGGVFNGDKEFTCADGLSGFTLRLKARFGGDGSTGTWNAVGGWGAFDGIKGSGSLVGIPQSDVQIDDVFTGLIR